MTDRKHSSFMIASQDRSPLLLPASDSSVTSFDVGPPGAIPTTTNNNFNRSGLRRLSCGLDEAASHDLPDALLVGQVYLRADAIWVLGTLSLTVTELRFVSEAAEFKVSLPTRGISRARPLDWRVSELEHNVFAVEAAGDVAFNAATAEVNVPTGTALWFKAGSREACLEWAETTDDAAMEAEADESPEAGAFGGSPKLKSPMSKVLSYVDLGATTSSCDGGGLVSANASTTTCPRFTSVSNVIPEVLRTEAQLVERALERTP